MPEGTGRFAGLTFGAIRRNSTPRQRDNYAAQDQKISVEAYCVREGARIVLYDEQATSGRRLSKRAVARDLLDDVAAGAIDGIAVTVLDRLTRDEIGKDAAVIAEVLIDARALLVTLDHIYKLWDKDDLFLYRLKTGLAGREVMVNTERFWNGVFQKAQSEVFFLGGPPWGYTTRVASSPAPAPGARAKLRHVPIKDDACADAMAALAVALDECTCLGDVCERMNAAGLHRRAVRGRLAGQAVRWQLMHLRSFLAVPIYAGTMVFARTSKRTSPIWDVERGGKQRRHQDYVLACPDLAWFAPERIAGWRAKFGAEAGAPRRRNCGHERPLRGLLACPACGHALTAAGSNGYACPDRRSGAISVDCPQPQQISEPLALRALRAALFMAISERDDRDAILRERIAAGDRPATKADELVKLRDGLAVMTAQWYPDGQPRAVPDFAIRMMAGAQAKINALQAEIDRAQRRATLTPDQERLFRELSADPTAPLATATPAQQAAIYRIALADVRVETWGHGTGRRWRVAGYRNLLLRT